MNRRKFIQLNSAAGLAVLFYPFCSEQDAAKIKRFGIQLYTIRDVFGNDPEGILKQLAAFGYKEIESYEGPKGMWWGFGAKGFKQRIEDLGMKLVSSHVDIKKDFDKKLEEAAQIGMKYLVCPYIGKQNKLDDYKKIAEDFNLKGTQCKKAGLRFGYHNHDYSFKLQDGQYPQDILMNNTDSSIIDYQMDIYWVVTAGEDPVHWLKKYPGRFKLCHIKDRTRNPGPENGKNSTDLGKGSIDFSSILKMAKRTGMEHFFVEQEFYPYGDSLNASKTNAVYMKDLRI